MRKKALVGAVALALAAAVYFLFFAGSDEEKIRATVSSLAHAAEIRPNDSNVIVRTARARAALSGLLTEDVHVNIPDLAGVRQGRDGIAEAVVQAQMLFTSADVDVYGLQIKLDDSKTAAQVAGQATVRGTTRAGEARTDQRPVDLLLRKEEGKWKVSSVTVWPAK